MKRSKAPQPDDRVLEVRRRIAHAVTDQRMRRGWDQAALAQHAGVPLDVVQAIEVGEHPIPIDTLTALTEALGTTPESLIAPTPSWPIH